MGDHANDFATYEGRRYRLGRTEAAYAIWHREKPDSPIELFPLTPHGWADAYSSFAAKGGPRPTRLTFLTLGLVLLAIALASPFAVLFFSYYYPVDVPHDWRERLFLDAFFIGVPSFVLALVSDRLEWKRRSRSGKRYAWLASALAFVGAVVSGLIVAAAIGSSPQ